MFQCKYHFLVAIKIVMIKVYVRTKIERFLFCMQFTVFGIYSWKFNKIKLFWLSNRDIIHKLEQALETSEAHS